MKKAERIRRHVLADPATVATDTAKRITRIATDAIRSRGEFHIVLAGGNTPRQTYQKLTHIAADWQCWQIYFGDERCLPADNQVRNSFMAKQSWLDHVPIANDQVHVIPAELGAEAAANAYSKVIESVLPFDLVLLGMGEDGHTASLFPNHQHDPDELVHAVHNAPKPPPDRVSLSLRSLNHSRHVIIQVTGQNKRDALEQWQAGADLPVTKIQGINGVELILDKAAAG